MVLALRNPGTGIALSSTSAVDIAAAASFGWTATGQLLSEQVVTANGGVAWAAVAQLSPVATAATSGDFGWGAAIGLSGVIDLVQAASLAWTGASQLSSEQVVNAAAGFEWGATAGITTDQSANISASVSWQSSIQLLTEQALSAEASFGWTAEAPLAAVVDITTTAIASWSAAGSFSDEGAVALEIVASLGWGAGGSLSAFAGKTVVDNVRGLRKYLLDKRVTAVYEGREGLDTTWKSKQLAVPGVPLPAGFPGRAVLIAGGYVSTYEDLDQSTPEEMVEIFGLDSATAERAWMALPEAYRLAPPA